MGVEYKDYYKTLGVSRSATGDEINKAFKKLARKYHPDLNANDSKAEEHFKEINEANEVLKDPEKRKMYDHLGADWQNGQQFRRPRGYENMNFSHGGAGGGDFSDFFETLFGSAQFRGAGGGQNPSGGSQFRGSFGGGQSPFDGFTASKGSDVNAEITLSLEEAFNGGKKTVTLQGASGTRSLEVNIPAGVKSGARIRLAKQGEPGRGGAGDLYLKVRITPKERFSLDDADIVYDLSLAPWEATLGCKLRVPTLAGEIELSIAPGTASGKKLRLRGKGLGSGTAKGDQIIRISIAVPDTLTDEERDLWQKLQELSNFNART